MWNSQSTDNLAAPGVSNGNFGVVTISPQMNISLYAVMCQMRVTYADGTDRTASLAMTVSFQFAPKILQSAQIALNDNIEFMFSGNYAPSRDIRGTMSPGDYTFNPYYQFNATTAQPATVEFWFSLYYLPESESLRLRRR